MSCYFSYIIRTKAKTKTCLDPISLPATTLFLVRAKLHLRADNADCLPNLLPLFSHEPVPPRHSNPLVKVTSDLCGVKSNGSFLT